MCGSVQNQPVYTPPAACPAPAPQAAPQAPKACTPPPCAPVDTFTPPPPVVVSPEKAAPIAPTVASPERPTISSTPNADAPAACAKNETVAPERKGLMKMLGAIFSAVFSFASMFMNRRPDVANADARPERNRADSHACARDWRNFEGRARPPVIAPERDVRPQAFTPSAYGQRV